MWCRARIQAQGILTDVGFALERNQLSDPNVEQIGNIIGHVYPVLNSVDLELGYQFSTNLTHAGITLMIENLINSFSLRSISIDISGNGIGVGLADMGKILGQASQLESVRFVDINQPFQGSPRLVLIGDHQYTGFFTGLAFRGDGSSIVNIDVDFSYNNVSDAGFAQVAGVIGRNLSNVQYLKTTLDHQVRPVTAGGVAAALEQLGSSWQQNGTWDLSIERHVGSTNPNATTPPAQLVAPGSILANITDALSCGTGHMFRNGVNLTMLEEPRLSYCDAMAVAAPDANLTNNSCGENQLRLEYNGRFNELCNMSMHYCGTCPQ